MATYIVITSIFNPTEAVFAFASLSGYKLLVVGDKKTPANWHCDNATFLSPELQESLGLALSRNLPYNHYCRKMLGYLFAIANKADVIIDTDDDNIPRPNWGFPAFTGTFPLIQQNAGHINIYELFTTQKIWPRGHPLPLIHKASTVNREAISHEHVKVGVWQGLANEDPDVDAIYRLTNDQPCIFEDNGPYVLGKGTACPFNSQNTAYIKDLFTLLYLPAFVTFRFTDILRGLVAQPIMWLHGFHLGFTRATVTQKRNPHDYLKDFESEVPMYLHAAKIIDLVASSISSSRTISSNIFCAYRELHRHNIVCKEEILCLEAWLADLERLH